MRILVISQYFYPEIFRINNLCFELTKHDHEVTVLTGLPNYPGGDIYEGYENKDNCIEEINNVKIIRCNIIPRKQNPLNLILNYFSFPYYAKKRLKQIKERFDIVFVFEVSPIFQVLPAKYYKKKYGCPVIINCQDIWPEVIKVYGIKHQGIIYKIVRKISENLYKSGDIIAISSPGFETYLNQICKIDKSLIRYLPNFAEDFYLSFNNQPKFKNRFHLLFAGNIGKAQDLLTIVKAIELLSTEEREHIIIDIVGDGSYLNTLIEEVNIRNLTDYFHFHGRKTQTELQSFYERASACLLTLEGNSPISLTVPSKLQGYMGAGKPVIAAINGGAKDIIEISQCGKCANAGDYKKLSIILKDFINQPDYYWKLGLNGRKYFQENFTITKYIKDLEKIMEEVL